MNTSLVQTAKGRTVVLQHDVVSPRPYSRINMLSGTLATFADYPPRIFFDPSNKVAPPRPKGEEEEWTPVVQDRTKRAAGGIEDRFEHPLWKELEAKAAGSGHGGMDYVMSWRLVQCMQQGLPARPRRLRRSVVERAGAAQREVGRAGQHGRRVPGLHARGLAEEAVLSTPSPTELSCFSEWYDSFVEQPADRAGHPSACQVTPDQRLATEDGRPRRACTGLASVLPVKEDPARERCRRRLDAGLDRARPADDARARLLLRRTRPRRRTPSTR